MAEIGRIFGIPKTKKSTELGNYFLREADNIEKKLLCNSIGENALDFARDKHTVLYFMGFDDYYNVEQFALGKGSRALEIDVKIPITEKPTIQLKFKALKYLGERDSKKTSDAEKLKHYLETETSLSKGALEFVRFARDFTLFITPQCEIYLQPSSKKRDRLYRKLLDPTEHPNIHFLPFIKDDTTH